VEPWTFVHVSDIQPGSPRSYRYNPSWIRNWRQAKKQIVDIAPDLVLVGGDLTRDGSIHRFELNMDTGNKHTRVIGRHRGPDQCTDVDLNVTSEQLRQFASVFGPLWWSVDHKNVRFSGFADVVVNSGLPKERAFWQWAEEQVLRPRPEHHVWIMHYALFMDRPDEPNWDIQNPAQYRNWYFSIDQPGRGRLLELFKATGAEIVISGHIHCHKVTYAEGIRFEIAPATAFAQMQDRWSDGDPTLGFLRYDVSDAGITPSLVPLERTYQLQGYGPGGHPAPHVRDYTLAWEKGE